jgi:hypothetical protein
MNMIMIGYERITFAIFVQSIPVAIKEQHTLKLRIKRDILSLSKSRMHEYARFLLRKNSESKE